jgi:hypothetical protein
VGKPIAWIGGRLALAGAVAVSSIGMGVAAVHAVSPAAPAPVPPITSEAFHFEPRGAVPADNDGLIPNPATPTGTPVGSALPCRATFVAGPGSSVTAATVNAAIARLQNRLTAPYAICLAGTFHAPLKVWGKWTSALLTLEPVPGRRAVLALGTVGSGAVDANEFDGVAGGVSIVDSRSVAVRGLVITGYHADGTRATPAGIYVEVRGAGFGGAPSACFTHGDGTCGDIYLVGNTITHIANIADQVATRRAFCNNGNIDAFGIEVESYGRGASEALQHVVIAQNSIADTRTGQSETLAVNGDVTDFLVAANRIDQADNIGIDVEGWYNGTAQARYGVVQDNVVANVDTWNNHAYGRWDAARGRCEPLSPNAAGIYDDGASDIWIRDNVVANTDQGISLDTENANRWTDHILVSGNTVWDSAGTRLGDPSIGPNPPGVPGVSSVAGHAYDAFYVDAFGPGSRIFDVYAYGNVFRNASAYFGGLTRQTATVVDFGGAWQDVVLWDNTMAGGGAGDPWDVLLEVDNRPVTPTGTVIDCTDYEALSRSANFALPNATFTSLAAWQHGNGYGWDRNSLVDRPPRCAPPVP